MFMQSSTNHTQKNTLLATAPGMAQEKPVADEENTGGVSIESTQTTPEVSAAQQIQKRGNWREWLEALQRIFPIYLATHIAFLLLTYLVNLFFVGDFSKQALKIHDTLEYWNHWDTGQFTAIAQGGYDGAWRTAFFPLYPLLEAVLTPILHKPYYAGLLISNLATLGLFTVLYRLVREETDEGQASRAVLYLAVFPTAFFLSAAYNEALFLFLAVFTFYFIRRGNWWLAGVCGLLASLTRSAGIFLLIPFCYEYLRQHEFNVRKIRFGIVGGALIPTGLGLFALYCYYKFHDLLAFSHAQVIWGRRLTTPWQGFSDAFTIISKHKVLTFDAMHNVIDVSAGLFMLVILILCFVGPWKFGRDRIVYGLYGVTFYLFLILFPSAGEFPFQSLSRLVIELFPAFVVLAAMGKRPTFNLYYLTISVSILAFMLLQFLMGRWIV